MKWRVRRRERWEWSGYRCVCYGCGLAGPYASAPEEAGAAVVEAGWLVVDGRAYCPSCIPSLTGRPLRLSLFVLEGCVPVRIRFGSR